MKELINELYNKDNSKSYHALLELERICTESNELYSYFNELINMLKSEKSYIRVRGFRLICALAKWDTENKINEHIDEILSELDDDTSTSVRQCLSKLSLILLYKIELEDSIEKKLKSINVSKYKETMQNLIRKDIDEILKSI